MSSGPQKGDIVRVEFHGGEYYFSVNGELIDHETAKSYGLSLHLNDKGQWVIEFRKRSNDYHYL